MASRPIFDDDVGPLDSAAVTSTSPMATGSMSSRIRRRVSPAGSCSSPCRNTCPMYNRRSSKRPGFSPSSRHTPRASAAAARSFPFPSFGRSEQTAYPNASPEAASVTVTSSRASSVVCASAAEARRSPSNRRVYGFMRFAYVLFDFLRSKSNPHPSGGQYRFIGVSPLPKYLIFGMGVSADLPYLCPYK